MMLTQFDVQAALCVSSSPGNADTQQFPRGRDEDSTRDAGGSLNIWDRKRSLPDISEETGLCLQEAEVREEGESEENQEESIRSDNENSKPKKSLPVCAQKNDKSGDQPGKAPFCSRSCNEFCSLEKKNRQE